MTEDRHIPRRHRTVIPLCIMLLSITAIRTSRANGMNGHAPPQLFDIYVDNAYLYVDFEGEREETITTETGRRVTQESRLYSPLIWLSLRGSIYHPYLFDFTLTGEIGPTWEDETISDSDATEPVPSNDGSTMTHRYQFDARILKNKPLNMGLNASESRSRTEYDFFKRVTTDSRQVGGDVRSLAGVFPFVLSVTQTDTTLDDPDRPRTRDELNLLLDGRIKGPWFPRTSVQYTFEDFKQIEGANALAEGQTHTAHLDDSRSFGTGRPVDLQSTFLYRSLDWTSSESSQVTVRERLKKEHTDHLKSDWLYNITRNEFAEGKNQNQHAQATLRHQLYKSLTSSLSTRISNSHEESTASERTRSTLGFAIAENYTKRLGDSARLNLNYRLAHDDETRDSSGSTLQIVNERQVLLDGNVVLLKEPHVDTESVIITDTSGSSLYTEDLDYRLIPNGAFIQIERVFGGTIRNGNTVLIDYAADNQSSSGFTRITQNVGARLSLANGFVTLYGSLRDVDISGGEDLILEEGDALTMGATLSHSMFRAGAEYLDYDSNTSPHTTTSLFQNFRLPIDQEGVLTVDFSQVDTEYEDYDREWRSYIGRYERQINPHTRVSVDGGFREERENNQLRDYGTAGCSVSFKFGYLSLHASYEFQDTQFASQTTSRHFARATIRRVL